MILSCVLAALSTMFAIAPYLLFYYALTAFLGGDGFWGWSCIGGAATALLLQPICFGLSTGIAHSMAFDTLHDLRISLLRKLTRLPLGYFSSRQSGALKRIVNENVEVLELFFSHQLPDMIAAMLMPIATLLLLVVIDWRLGLAAAGIIPIVWMANILIMRGHGDKIGRYFGMLGRINATFVEYLQGIAAIKNLGGGDEALRRLQEQVSRLREFSAEWQQSWLGPWTLFSVATGASLLFVVPIGLALVVAGSATHLHLLFAVLCATGIGAPIIKLMLYTEIFLRVQKAEESIDRLMEEAEIGQHIESRLKPDRFSFAFRNVGFAQGGREILSGIDLNIPENSTTAIVGASGAGKTTLVRLIARYLDVSSGELYLGDHNIQNFVLDEVLEKIAFISQEVFLFNDSVLENIRMGREDVSLEDVIAAAKAANAHKFISILPDGYESPVGENGSALSGGERQRLSLARALLRDTPVLILDEATAHLDPHHEMLIQEAINRLVGRKTIIVVSHRLDSIRHCDTIVLMEKGRVAASGAHDELLQTSQTYARLWSLQQENLRWTLSRPSASPQKTNDRQIIQEAGL